MEKVLYKHVSKWIPHQVRNDRGNFEGKSEKVESVNGQMRRWAEAKRFIPIIGQISRLRCAPLEMTRIEIAT